LTGAAAAKNRCDCVRPDATYRAARMDKFLGAAEDEVYAPLATRHDFAHAYASTRH